MYFNNHLISKFIYLLSYENWEDVFLETNVSIIFWTLSSESFIQVFLWTNHNILIHENHG
jgi:hypothetical protein